MNLRPEDINYMALPGLGEKRVFGKLANVTLEVIESLVIEYFQVKRELLSTRRRDRDILEPRHMAMYLMRKHTPYSLKVIGRRYKRDHTSVVHAVQRITEMLAFDETIQRDVLAIEDKMKPF